MHTSRILAVALLLAAAACDRPAPSQGTTASATLAVLDARVWTGVPGAPWAEAVAVRGNELAVVGSRADVTALLDDSTTVIDGALVVPGFIDTHVHFLWGGDGLASVQLRDAATPQEFTRRIAAFAADLEPGEWVLNGTWDHENWGGELPRRDWIDAVTGDHPVWVTRLDGHMGLANSRALALAGVNADTAAVPGGSIVRAPDGTPTGVLKDNAMRLIEDVVPEPGPPSSTARWMPP